MVQNGKFSAGAEALVKTLKKVDLLWSEYIGSKFIHLIIRSYINISYPTFGNPTIPHLRELPNLPSRGPNPSDSDAVLFFGGIPLTFLLPSAWSFSLFRSCK